VVVEVDMGLAGTVDELLGGRCVLKEEDGRDMISRRDNRLDLDGSMCRGIASRWPVSETLPS